MKTAIRNGSQDQMQFVLPPPVARFRRSPVRPCPPARARWWFEQMRRAVADGVEEMDSGHRRAGLS